MACSPVGLIVAKFEGLHSLVKTSNCRETVEVFQRFAITGVVVSFLGAAGARAQEACVVCSGPDVTYRCTVEKSDKLARFGLSGDKAVQHVCAKEMARLGPHEKCSVRREAPGAVCDGQPRMITIANLLDAAIEPPAAGPANPPSLPAPAKDAAVKTEPPKTVQEMAERTSATSKQQLKDAGNSVGDAATRTWKCLTTLFQKC